MRQSLFIRRWDGNPPVVRCANFALPSSCGIASLVMFTIRPIRDSDLEAIKDFTDKEIGHGYYSNDELKSIFRRSQKDGQMCSLLLEDTESNVRGIRISYPPGQWEHGKGVALKSELWPHDQKDTAYFQSLFIASNSQGKGFGQQLSQKALLILREVGAKGVVCHAWKESPNNSSIRYLEKIGFKPVAEHKQYWRDVNYNCTLCKAPPCLCTAVEMYLDLQGEQ